jgi:DNA polymerase III subunit epsilon
MSSYRPIFFDLETTGTRPDTDRIVEIAAFDPVRNQTFQQLVHPGIVISDEMTAIHGISNAMVQEAPSFARAGAEFINFCSGNVLLVAHNGEMFDVPFLRAECKRHKLAFPSGWGLIDSLKWARKYRRDLPRHALQYLREMFGIPQNQAHRALDDVMTLYKVFSLLTDDLTPEEILDRGDGIKELSLPSAAASQAVGEDKVCVLELF